MAALVGIYFIIIKPILSYGASKEREDRAAEKHATTEAALESAKDQLTIANAPDADIDSILGRMRNDER